MDSRILFFMATGSPIGGVETWLDRVCARLAERGFDPLVALVRGQATNRPERFRAYHPSLPTVEVDGRGMNREGRIRAAERCIRSLRPGAVLPLGIVDANDATIRRKIAAQPVRLIGRAQGNLPPMLADLAYYRDWFDLVICPGSLTARFLVQMAGFRESRVRHIPNGADAAVTHHIGTDATTPLRLGYAGRFSQGDKRVLDVIQLCNRLDELGVAYTLDMAGDGPAREQLEAQLRGGGRRVLFHGALPHHEVYASILPKLDVSLLFSESEAFGISIVEAMTNGVVPVTSRYVGFHSEGLVLDGRTGLSFPVGDTRAAARAIESLAADRGLLRRLAATAREHAQAYSWDRCLEAWARTLEATLEREPLLGTRPPAMPERATRLDRWGVPPALTDLLRRGRRWVAGPPTKPGGEEWPLFHRHHPADSLKRIEDACHILEASGIEKRDLASMDNVQAVAGTAAFVTG